jgi:hypothetical protein
MGWQRVIEAPYGIAGVSSGSFGVSTAHLVIKSTATENGNTGSSEGSLDDKHFLVDCPGPHTLPVTAYEATRNLRVSNLGTIFLTDEPGLNGNTSSATDCHAIQASEEAAMLSQGDGTTLVNVVVNHGTTDQSEIGKSGSVVNGSTIPVSDIDLSRDLAAQAAMGPVPILSSSIWINSRFKRSQPSLDSRGRPAGL